MGPITQAIDALRRAESAFRDHGLLKGDECAVCFRMVRDGVGHTSDCPVDGISHAVRRLQEFQSEVSK